MGASRGNLEQKAGWVILLFLLVWGLVTLHSGCAGVASSGNSNGPTVSVTSPTSGATVSASIAVSANASANTVGVQFELDGANLGSEKTSKPFSISWDTTTTANGQHTVTAVARNAAGQTATSAPVTLMVQNSSSGGPTVSITSPTSDATVSGTTIVTASASSTVGIAGVQFLLDGANLGAEVTTSPYSFPWDTTGASNGSHTLAARARDTAGTTVPSIGVTVTVSNGSGGSDFQTRCSAPGVVRCNGFDSPADIAGNFGDNVGTLPNDIFTQRPVIDTTVKASGTGSIKFTIPSQIGSDTSGAFFTNFSPDDLTQFGQNQEFYVQWRQRFDPGMLRVFRTAPPPQDTGGFKLAIIGEGDRPTCNPVQSTGNSCATTCTELESVLTTSYYYLGPWFYHSCGRFISLDFFDGTGVRLQAPSVGSCYLDSSGLLPMANTTGCFKYSANEWMTFQVHIKIGTWNTASSRIEVWAAREGQPSVQIYDSNFAFPSGFTLYQNSTYGAKFGKVWLLPYMTNKDATEVYPQTYTWYDELIISRQKISDPK